MASPALKANKKQTARRLWLAVHLYLGLSLGLVIAVVGLTGSLLVFYLDLDEWLNPQLVIAQPGAQRQSYEACTKLYARRNQAGNAAGGWKFLKTRAAQLPPAITSRRKPSTTALRR